MLWTVIAILIILWFLGLFANVGGQFIHLLLIGAAVILIFNLLNGRRRTV